MEITDSKMNTEDLEQVRQQKRLQMRRQMRRVKQVTLSSLQSETRVSEKEISYEEVIQKCFLNISVKALFDALHDHYHKQGNIELEQQCGYSYTYLLKNIQGAARMSIGKLLNYVLEENLMATSYSELEEDGLERISEEEAEKRRMIGAVIVKGVMLDVFSPYEEQKAKELTGADSE